MLKEAHKILYIVLFFVTIFTFSQTGPGGVGLNDGSSSLKFWIRTDAGVSTTGSLINGITNSAGVTALDISETGTQRPTLVSSAINGYDEISFSGSNRLRTGLTLTTSNFVTNQASSFMVARADNTTQTSSVYTTDPLVGSTRFSNHIPWSNTVYYDFGTCCGTTARIQVGSLGGLTSYSLWTYDVNSSTGKQLYRNGTLLQNRAGVSSYTNHATQRFNIGANTSGTNGFVGDVAEVIVFREKINTTQRIIVDNYLSAKFGLTLNVNDFYNEDTSGGNFDHKVAGIGQATDGTNHTDSQGTGIIRINTPSALSNDDFLFWGEDVKDADYDFSTSIQYTERIDTKWRVSKRNNLGTVTVSVAATDIDVTGKESCAPLRLVVDNDSDFSSITNTYTLTLSSGIYSATGVSFTDNDYFTLEYTDQIVLDGTTAYNGAGTLNKPNRTDDCYKLLVKTNTLTLSEDADVREVEVEASSVLAVDSGLRLQVTNGINNSGDIRLVGNSQLVQTHTGSNLNTGSGNLYVDQTATTSSVYQSGYWSSPVSATIGAPFSIDDVLKDGNVPTAATPTAGEAGNINFNGAHDGNASSPIQISTRWLATFNNAADWTRFVSSTANVLTPGLGWNMKSVGAKFTFKGKPNDGDYSYSITKDNFSLIGNPYPSALDSQAFIDDNSSQFNGILYIYDSSSDNTHVRGAYTGTYTTIVSGVSVGGGRYLPIGQAFFITREAAGTGSLTFKNSQRTLVNLGDTAGLVARNSIENEQIESKGMSILKIGFNFDLSSTEKRTRQVAIAFRGLTDNYESGFDAEMWSLQPTDVYLTVKDRDNPFIITGVENFKSSLAVPLVVQLDQQRDITFSLDEINNINASVYLLDNDLQKLYSLDNGPQVLNLLEGKYTDRFSIVFSKKILSNVDSEVNENLITIFESTKGQLTIKNTSNLNIETIKLYNLLGVEVKSYDIKTNVEQLNLDISKISKSVYIITLKTDKGIINKKIILK